MFSKSMTSNGHRARLRERFRRTGLDGFSEREAMELLLTLAIPRQDVKTRAEALLRRFGGLRGVLDAPLEELRAVPGIGEAAATALKIVRQASELYLRQTAEAREPLAAYEAMERFWRVRLGGLQHEEFHAAYLDSSLRLLKDGVERLEAGIPNQAVVYPRKLMASALRRGAAALVVAHNHPAGEAWPSEQDLHLTRELAAAARPLQVRLLDHLVITADGAFSFRREGLL